MNTAPIVNSLPELVTLLENVRRDKRLVCTIGSWDILHQGHVEYLRQARELGDLLVVGVDSDVAYQRHKKKPVMYPQIDRQNILSSLRFVDYVTIVEDVDISGEWQMELIKSVKPDVFVCNTRSYPDDQMKRIAKLCSIEVVPFYHPPASSSSAAVAEDMKKIVKREREVKNIMRVVTFSLITALVALSVLTSIAMFILEGFGIGQIRADIFETFIYGTVAEVVGLMFVFLKYLFGANGRKPTSK